MELLTQSVERHDPRYEAAHAFFPYMSRELPKTGVTRQLLWQEYKARHPDGYERSQFCDLFRRWSASRPELSMSLNQKAGDRLFVDFADALQNISKKWTMPICDCGSAMNKFVILYGDRVPL